MDDCLDLESVECKSIDEAICIGEDCPSKEYHIIIKGKQTILAIHPFWQKCKFCSMEDENGFIKLSENDS